jgi:hypothetical protein
MKLQNNKHAPACVCDGYMNVLWRNDERQLLTIGGSGPCDVCGERTANHVYARELKERIAELVRSEKVIRKFLVRLAEKTISEGEVLPTADYDSITRGIINREVAAWIRDEGNT